MSIASCSTYSSGDTSLPSFKVHSRKSDSQRSSSSDKEPIQVSVTRLLVPEYQEELRKERQVGVGNVDPTRPAPIIVTTTETLFLLQEAAGKLSHGLVEVVDSKGMVSVLDTKVFNSSKHNIANKNLGIIKKQPWKDRFIAGNICGFLATGLGVAGIVVKDTVDFPVLTCFSGSESLSFGRFGFVQAIFYNSFIAASTLSVEIIAGLLLFSLSAENSQEVDRPQSKFGCLGRLWNSILRGSTQSDLEQYSGGEFKVSLGCGAIGFSRRLAPSPLLQLIGEIDGADDVFRLEQLVDGKSIMNDRSVRETHPFSIVTTQQLDCYPWPQKICERSQILTLHSDRQERLNKLFQDNQHIDLMAFDTFQGVQPQGDFEKKFCEFFKIKHSGLPFLSIERIVNGLDGFVRQVFQFLNTLITGLTDYANHKPDYYPGIVDADQFNNEFQCSSLSLVLSGEPGTGKTCIMSVFLDVMKEMCNETFSQQGISAHQIEISGIEKTVYSVGHEGKESIKKLRHRADVYNNCLRIVQRVTLGCISTMAIAGPAYSAINLRQVRGLKDEHDLGQYPICESHPDHSFASAGQYSVIQWNLLQTTGTGFLGSTLQSTAHVVVPFLFNYLIFKNAQKLVQFSDSKKASKVKDVPVIDVAVERNKSMSPINIANLLHVDSSEDLQRALRSPGILFGAGPSNELMFGDATKNIFLSKYHENNENNRTLMIAVLQKQFKEHGRLNVNEATIREFILPLFIRPSRETDGKTDLVLDRRSLNMDYLLEVLVNKTMSVEFI